MLNLLGAHMLEFRRPRKLTLLLAAVISITGLAEVVLAFASFASDFAVKLATFINSIVIGTFLTAEGLALLTLRVPPPLDELRKEQEEELRKIMNEIEVRLKNEICMKGESDEEQK